MEILTELSPSALAEEFLPEIEGFNRFIRHEPLGIVLNIASWNYPLLVAVNITVAAILAGNSVILKHSALTPLCGNVFERAFLSAGAPEYLMNAVIMDHITTEKIIESGKIDHVAFTGSVSGGHRIHRAAANNNNFIDTGLELGGKDPAYIREDADLEVAIDSVMDGAFYNAGQSCCAVERIYVHHSRYEEFVSRAIQWLDAQIIGDPMDKSTTMGPLAKQTGIDTLNRQIKQAEECGAVVHPYGGTIPETGQYCRPVILTQVDHSMAIMTDETFGPAVGIMSVVGDAEAIRLMNDSPFGLTASVWTHDREQAMSIGNQINTGTFYMNRCDYLDPALPWVGVKDSGKGTSLSRIGIRNLTRPKSIHLKTE